MPSSSKEAIERRIKLLGGEPDGKVENVWWLNGHCILLKQRTDGNWETEEL